MLAKGELVLIRYPGLNMYTVMKKSVHEAGKFSHELVFEFDSLDDFIKKGIKYFSIWCRLPDKHGLEGMDDELKLIKRVIMNSYTYRGKGLAFARIYIEQPNGNIILVYEPKGGFII